MTFVAANVGVGAAGRANKVVALTTIGLATAFPLRSLAIIEKL